MSVLSAVVFIAALFDLTALVSDLERANIRGDVATIDRVREDLDRALDSAPDAEREDIQYALAYTGWRLAAFEERGSDPFERRLKAAEAVLEKLLEDRPDNAEAQALYATVQGNLITGMWSGMRRGPRAGKARERARAIAPENPRVVMQEGVSRLFRPRMVGGGLDKAERELLRALELFEREPPDSPWPNWGRVEIYGWLAIAAARQGDSPRAREYCETALSLEPDYHWIRELMVDIGGEVREFERDPGAPPAASSAWRVAARHRVWAALVSRTVGPVVLGNAQKGGGPVSFHTVSAEVASP